MMLEQKPRILVVEDEESLLATVLEELDAGGFTVDPATTGEEAIRKIEKDPPSLILLDMLLGGSMDGLAVLSRLKSAESTRDIPVVILSNVGDDTTVEAALELGAESYMVKTQHDLGEIIDRLREILETRRK